MSSRLLTNDHRFGMGSRKSNLTLAWGRDSRSKAVDKWSSFWNGIQKVKFDFSLGARFEVKDGRANKWLGDTPLFENYHNLYMLAVETEASVHSVFHDSLSAWRSVIMFPLKNWLVREAL